MKENKALISIDFWDTLVDGRTGGEKRRQYRINALREIASNKKMSLSDEQIGETFKATTVKFKEVWFGEQRTMNLDEVIRFTADHLDLAPTEKEILWLAKEYDDSLWEGPPAVVPGASEVVSRLAERYRLAVISDTMFSSGKILRKHLENNGLLHYFSSFLFSNEAGYSKPDRRAYLSVLEECGCSPEASWHIGDRLKTDIRGAKEVGMKAILFTQIEDRTDQVGNVNTEPDAVCRNWEEVADLLLDPT